MKDQAERFPTVVASHAFNMRQTSSLALHLRSPFPRLRKTNAKAFGGFPTTPAFAGGSQNVRGRLRLPLDPTVVQIMPLHHIFLGLKRAWCVRGRRK